MTPETFWQNVDQSGGPDACWPWTRTLNPANGYGSARWEGRVRSTHRLAWELGNGQPVPPGLLVCHHCDNRPCCNPAHLYAGTSSQNVADMIARGSNVLARRTHCASGHEYTPENTRLRAGKGRICRECMRQASRIYKARVRQQSA